MTNQTYPQPVPQRKGLPWWGWTLIAAVPVAIMCVGGLFLIGLATDPTTARQPAQDDVISNSDNEQNPPVADVELTGCEVDQFGWTVATLDITNNSSKASSYDITVEVLDGDGNRLEEAYVFVEALRPDQSTTVEAQGLEDVSDASGVDCALLTVDRYSSEG